MWKGQRSDLSDEQQGVRQGGSVAPVERKSYSGSLISTLEDLDNNKTLVTSQNDIPSTHHATAQKYPTSVVAVADDKAPSSSDINPRKAISQLQVLLYAAEEEGKQLHIDFGADKYHLLVTAKPGKLKETFNILEPEPGVLTFYSQPVNVIQPGDHYIHLGVPQAPTKQSKISAHYRTQK